jgi:N-acyl-D-aspartate/D-glutamate deacylase
MKQILVFLGLFFFALGGANVVAGAEPYDLVISNGRVIDPETGLDGIRHVGIQDGSIVVISEAEIEGASELDATGQVVAPGFVDIHTHSPSRLGGAIQVLDGVTTQLDLEAGAFPVSAYGDHYAGGTPINFGASVAHFAVRAKVIEGRDTPYLFTGTSMMRAGLAFVQEATSAQIEEMRILLGQGLDDGGLGIGVLLDYMSVAVSEAELRMIFEVAGSRKVPVFVHVRRGFAGDPAGLIEVIALAEETGAPLLISHITHSAMHAVPEWLALIDAANARGALITTETLSYAAGGTSISAAVFGREWQKIFNIDYSDVQWTATGEWLTQESWEKYRAEQPTGMVNHHYVKEGWIEAALAWPGMMVSTDVTPALDRDILANPNGAGTFSRFLGHYVRERELMTLSDGLARITLFPAQWMEGVAPQFARKGRVQVGADADLVVFSADDIEARATYGDPFVPPVGLSHVVVGGRIVVDEGVIVEGRYPGQRILGEGGLARE